LAFLAFNTSNTLADSRVAFGAVQLISLFTTLQSSQVKSSSTEHIAICFVAVVI